MSRKRPVLDPVPLWDEPALRSTIAAAGGNPDVAPRVYRHLLSDPSARVEDVPGLSKAALAAIAAKHAVHTIRVVDVVVSGGGEAIKMLLELQDGQRVEAVVMVYDTRGKAKEDEELEGTGERVGADEAAAPGGGGANGGGGGGGEADGFVEPPSESGGAPQRSAAKVPADLSAPSSPSSPASSLYSARSGFSSPPDSPTAPAGPERGLDPAAFVDVADEGADASGPAPGASARRIASAFVESASPTPAPGAFEPSLSTSIPPVPASSRSLRRRRRGGRPSTPSPPPRDRSSPRSTLPRPRSSWGHRRATLCVSSQIGCAMACTFCATGTLGLKGNLSAGEIVEQLYLANKLQRLLADAEARRREDARGEDGGGDVEPAGVDVPSLAFSSAALTSPPPPPSDRVDTPFPPALLARVSAFPAPPPLRNVVFMGMGEPLQNYEAVTAACRTMTDGAGFALRRSAVTVSTVGVVPRMRSLADDVPGVSLALSLHAPNQELRKQLVPSARAYPLRKILDATDVFVARTAEGRERARRELEGPSARGASKRAAKARVFYEYVLLGGVNDAPEHARELGALLRGRPATVNLIPWNPVLAPGYSYAAPGADNARRFQTILRTEFGVPATVRAEKGQDVAAACGQLALSDLGRKKTQAGGCGGGGSAGGGDGNVEIEDLLGSGSSRARMEDDERRDNIKAGNGSEGSTSAGLAAPLPGAIGKARGFVRRLVGRGSV